MSWRIHVCGAYGATAAEFRAALDSIGEDGAGSSKFRIGASGKWQWANASVWHVDGSAIDKALSSLPVPALRVTSSDAVLWMLTLTQPGKDPFRGVHHFTSVGCVPDDPQPEDEPDADFPANEIDEVAGINRFVPELEFLWDAEEAARMEAEQAKFEDATVPCLEDYADYGVTLPAAVIEDMKRHPHRAWPTAFMAHGPQIVEALKDYGFDFDPEAMLRLLTVGPKTSRDDSDIGNMPRFLELLGIENVFPELEEQPAAGPPEVDGDWSKFPPGELFAEFDPLLARCPLIDISGGPVELPRVSLLNEITFLMSKVPRTLWSKYPTTFVRMQFRDPESEPPEFWRKIQCALEVRHQAGEWQFCFSSHTWLWSYASPPDEEDETELQRLDEAVQSSPDRMRFEIAFILEGLPELCYRYAGTYADQRFLLEQAYPPVTMDVLNEAFALATQRFGFKAIALASDEEIESVRREYVHTFKTPPKIRDGRIMPDAITRYRVIRTLFLERMANRGPWGVAAAREIGHSAEEREANSVTSIPAEADEEALEGEWTKFPAGELSETFDRLSAECPLTEISGGPVEVTHAVLLHFLTHLLCEDLPTSVRIEFPDASQPGESWQELDSLEVRRRGRQWQFCFSTPHWWFGVEDREELDTNRLAAALGSPPDGTRFEITMLVAGLSDQCHRYAGTYRNQRLAVEQSFPVLAADVLTDALALADRVFDTKSIEIADDEVDVVKRNYERSASETPRIRKGKIKPDPGDRKVVVQTLLFERFASRGAWDIAGAREKEEESWREFERLCEPDAGAAEANDSEEGDGETEESAAEIARLTEMMQKMQAATERMQAAKVVPHRDEVIYEGRTGKFYRASLSDLEHVSPEKLAEHDAAMAALGFRSVGDAACDADQRQSITRCYTGRPEAFGLHSRRKEDNQLAWISAPNGMVSVDFSEGENEFRTYFDDDTILVTTSLDAAKSKPEIGLYVRSYEDVPLEKLWEKHLDGIRRFHAHRGTAPVDHTQFADPALRLAKADELICRFMGKS